MGLGCAQLVASLLLNITAIAGVGFSAAIIFHMLQKFKSQV